LAFWVALAAVCLAGCSEDKAAGPAEQGKGAVSKAPAAPAPGNAAVFIHPGDPTVRTGLQAIVRGEVRASSFIWERNGQEIDGQNSDRLQGDYFQRGDDVIVRAITSKGELRTSKSIGNSLPEIVALPFVDPHIKAGVDIEVIPEAFDPDGDFVDFRYSWKLNGEELPDLDSPVMSADRFRKGDRIFLTVFPRDQDGEGEPYRGLEFVIPNAPPVFVTVPPKEFTGFQYTYEAHAEDPDGDVLEYYLESAPSGMTIDNGSGSITWQVTRQDAGEQRVRVVARDEEGMRAIQEYTLVISIAEQAIK